ncbi:hydroxyacid dehydrogenase [Qingshengfaniella alkalisoli]|uniref:Hydroxyacid dehydrogenase n=1 Tax=Qingshengfaniella alkalisoli TaxID=2599296 RepID=A0A5B8ISL7_9RHOB|nr:hydroxyacid dehydrogenase [Qingshengfaniella alkalisoli]QDY69212.1 hydroxyacid dehydrogenase [Qingshengfaniella alkalisoli]
MTKIAILMPESTYQRQITPAHLRDLEAIADDTVRHFSDIESLQIDPEMAQAEVVITGWGSSRFSAACLDRLPNLRLIAHGAGTLRFLIDPVLLEHGIRVTSSAAANAIPVAEFTLSWILRWNKMLPFWETAYKQSPDSFPLRGNNKFAHIGNINKTIGIIGASKVGRHLLQLLQSFDMECLLADPFVSASDIAKLGASKVELSELLERSDIVSLNAPLLKETRGMIGTAELARMKDGALLINTARGPMIDHDALLRELQSERLSAVLDVTDPEPLPDDSPFLALDNVFLTPHVAGSLGTEIHRMTDSVISEIKLFLDKGELRHEVRLENWATAA